MCLKTICSSSRTAGERDRQQRHLACSADRLTRKSVAATILVTPLCPWSLRAGVAATGEKDRLSGPPTARAKS